MHVETYPAFFTPRDKEPSLSSSEEKSSEFDWLERKKNEKTKIYMKSRASALYFTSFPKLYKGCISENKLPDLHIFYIPFSKENYKLYIRGYSPLFPNLITKESYDRWVTRRVWGFKHQISKAKYLKMSVTHIWII